MSSEAPVLNLDYAGLTGPSAENDPHLGGNINLGDPFAYSPAVWNYVISRFCIDSVLDLGSGSGNASVHFHRQGLKVVAVDGLAENVEKSLFPSTQHDLTQSAVNTRVDLVHCQEVVEHIEEQFIENVLRSLTTGRIILMTHALPGDPGHHHVNLQSTEYWVWKLLTYNCTLLIEDTNRIRKLAREEGAVFMGRSGLVFINNSRL